MRPVNPRARRSADIAASVPELVKRTRSTCGYSAQIRSASSVSITFGAPYDSP